MPSITAHKINDCNKGLTIIADEPDPTNGNASHHYDLYWHGKVPEGGVKGQQSGASHLDFQHGPVEEVGTNGVTHEALIAIVISRLESFQTGPYKCRENAVAITKLEEAMHWLEHRTKLREARGVEGTHTP